MSVMSSEQQVKAALQVYEDVDTWKTFRFLYKAAMKEVNTKLEILNDEFQHVHQYNPIEHIKTRIKTAESIVKKLRRYGYETSMDNMVRYVNDIAGVRVICSFTSDIYRLAEMIGNQSDLKVLSITIAMDFWASLEHKIYYKFEGNAPDYISRDLRECARVVEELDERMLQLNEAIQKCIVRDADGEELMDSAADELADRTEQIVYHFKNLKTE